MQLEDFPMDAHACPLKFGSCEYNRCVSMPRSFPHANPSFEESKRNHLHKRFNLNSEQFSKNN